jgi:DNA-binding MarR family transcriptional regulator
MQLQAAPVGREAALEELYQGLSLLVRRSRELSEAVHPGLSLAAYTVLDQIEGRPGTRSADLAAMYGLDKSTVSRQVDQLEGAGLLRRLCEQPGRRGQALELTAEGAEALRAAADSVRGALAASLSGWDGGDLHTFALLLARFNEDTSSIGACPARGAP